MLDGVWSTGEATYNDDMQLFLERNGYPEETYHTFSYSAIRDAEGKIVALTLVLGPLDRILARALNKEDQAELEIVQRNSLRLLKLVNTLLDFSRFQAGRYDARFEQTNLSDFTSDLVSLFRSAVENVGLKLQVNCAALTENAYVDQDMWEKIVLNLVSNAFKFTLEGTIKVTLEQTEKDFVLSVSDTGGGIPAEELENIFKRFYRVKAETARTYEGSGIGLSLVTGETARRNNQGTK